MPKLFLRMNRYLCSFGFDKRKNLNKKQKIEGWFLQRNYLHFDSPLSFKNASLFVKDFKQVSSHAFLPFLTFNVKTIKYKKNSDTGKKERIDKIRPLCYSSHLDGYIYSYYAKNLSELYEKKLSELKIDKSILAFRKFDGKSNIHFAKEAFDDILDKGECTAIALDFSSFFDTLDHNILKDEWCKLLDVSILPTDYYNIYKSLTKYSLVNKDEVYKLFNIPKNNPKNRPFRICTIKDFREKVRKNNTLIKQNPKISEKKGIPQGSSLSALLSNIYMLDFDKKIYDYINSLNGKYYRYCDDILIIINTNKVNEVEVYINDIIKVLKVEINPKKTLKCDFKLHDEHLHTDKELQYLGFMFNGEKVYLRSASISRYHQKLKKSISLSKKTMSKYNKIRKDKGKEELPLFKKKLYEKYSHLGKSNFIKYGLRAKKIMNSPEIKKQIKKLSNKLNQEICF
jgi:hypothetical protein